MADYMEEIEELRARVLASPGALRLFVGRATACDYPKLRLANFWCESYWLERTLDESAGKTPAEIDTMIDVIREEARTTRSGEITTMAAEKNRVSRSNIPDLLTELAGVHHG